MTINIITKSNKKTTTIRGPKKVLDNLIKGLDLIGIKYTFNGPIGKHKFNWIHDSPSAIIEAGFVGKNVLIGPNIVELPDDLPILRKKLSKDSIKLLKNFILQEMTLCSLSSSTSIFSKTFSCMSSFAKK